MISVEFWAPGRWGRPPVPRETVVRTREKAGSPAAYPHLQETADFSETALAVGKVDGPKNWTRPVTCCFAPAVEKVTDPEKQGRKRPLTRPPRYQLTSRDRPQPAADKRGRCGCRVSSRAESALAAIWGHATLQTPMGIYHANLQRVPIHVSPGKVCSFSPELAVSRREQAVQTSTNKIGRELSEIRN